MDSYSAMSVKVTRLDSGVDLTVKIPFELFLQMNIPPFELFEEILPDISKKEGLDGVVELLTDISNYLKAECQVTKLTPDGIKREVVPKIHDDCDQCGACSDPDPNVFAKKMAEKHVLGEDDLPPCRACGARPQETAEGICCSNVDCILTLVPMPVETWVRNWMEKVLREVG